MLQTSTASKRLPRRCAPRNDGLFLQPSKASEAKQSSNYPSLRGGTTKQSPDSVHVKIILTASKRLPRRYAPRNDGLFLQPSKASEAKQSPNYPSLRGGTTKQSPDSVHVKIILTASKRLPRRYAPRNDGLFLQPSKASEAKQSPNYPSLRGGTTKQSPNNPSLRATAKQSPKRYIKAHQQKDCHVAALLAMTGIGGGGR